MAASERGAPSLRDVTFDSRGASIDTCHYALFMTEGIAPESKSKHSSGASDLFINKKALAGGWILH